MIIKRLYHTLPSLLLIASLVSGDEKWAWGQDKVTQQSTTPDFNVSTKAPDTTTTNKQSSVSQVQGRSAPVPEARTAGLFKKLACKVGLCKDEEEYGYIEQYPSPYPVPYPAPFPVPVAVPVLAAQPQLVQSAFVDSYPAATGDANGYYGPQQIAEGYYGPQQIAEGYYGPQQIAEGYPAVEAYPPIEGYPPRPIIVEQGYNPEPTEHHHHHVHTHLHNDVGSKGKPLSKPYRGDSLGPQQSFAPTIITGGNNRLPPIKGTPELNISPLYRPTGPQYNELCQCVLPHYCSPYDIIQSNNGRDIAHLISPRTEAGNTISNSTAFTVRVRRDAQVQNKLTSSASTAKGRALIGYEPGLSGCQNGYVCCRNPIDQIREPRHGVCGKSLKSSIHGRIANTDYNKGTTEFGQYPWQAAILKDDKYESTFVCGATLISERHVLTAAHCLKDIFVPYIKIRLGEWDVNSEKEFYKHQDYAAESIQIHPKFYPGNLENDIAVITLKGYVDFYSQPHISPICIPDAHQEFTGQQCYVTGWGKDAFGNKGEFQRILKEVNLPIIDRRTCEYALQRTRLGYNYRLPLGFICAGGEPGKDTCKGDGGGPLVCSSGYNNFQLAGIVSWGIDCGLPGVPGVYVDIPYYVDWIKSISVFGNKLKTVT